MDEVVLGALIGAGAAFLGQVVALYGQFLLDGRRLREERAARWEAVQRATYERYVAAATAYRSAIRRAQIEHQPVATEAREALNDATASLLIGASDEVQEAAVVLRGYLYTYANHVEDQLFPGGNQGGLRPEVTEGWDRWRIERGLDLSRPGSIDDWRALRDTLVQTMRRERRVVTGLP